ncbi:MFS general substrate transporter [Dendrothele bispora CBS 962.96]|uniref:MFS general substrate transporter n=1 Tax=Dendrothele bispora (strain CBS 962.96) TaxID=1314807 RepID=A0A4S8MLB7_DENBC|nr:MFS general substrate transporter [Dendrothele bispora CBS 962.96]
MTGVEMTAQSSIEKGKSTAMTSPDTLDVDAQSAQSPRPRTMTPLRSMALVTTCTLAMITNLASSAAVSVFLPIIGQELNVAEDSLQWTVSAFSLSSGCFLIFFGRLADLYGRKKAFLLGTFFLGAMSIGCGFAQNAVTLYVLRGLQGLGPAAFLPACLGILAQSFPHGRARSAAFATFSAGAPLGGAIGTQIGALLTEKTRYTWRDPFFLFAGLSFLCVIGGYLTIEPDSRVTKVQIQNDSNKTTGESVSKRIGVDWIGAFLITTALGLIIFTLGQGSVAPRGWRTDYIISLLIIGVFFLLVFLLWQHWLEKHYGAQAPLMKLSLWSRSKGKFAVMQSIAFMEWAGFLSWFFWAQIYYEDFVGLSPVLTAVRMLPMTVAGVICNVFVVLVIGRLDLVVLIALGTLFTSIGALLFALIDPSAPYWAFGFPSAIVAVFGGDFVFAAGTLFIAKISEPDEQSLAGGLFQTLTQLGTAFGLAISTIVHSSVTQKHRDSNTGSSTESPAPLQAYQAAQWTAFGFAMFCTALAIIFLRGVGPVGASPGSQGPQAEADESRQSQNSVKGEREDLEAAEGKPGVTGTSADR